MCLLMNRMTAEGTDPHVDKKARRQQSRLYEARGILAQHYAQDLTLEQIAREVGLNKLALTSVPGSAVRPTQLAAAAPETDDSKGFNAAGKAIAVGFCGSFPAMMLTPALQREAYRRMLRIRRFEEEGTRLFKAGKIPGAFHASIGQEAAIVGACLALRNDDTICGTHRSHGHPIGKGADLSTLMAELMAKSTGISKGRGGSMHLADRSVGIIGQSAIVGGGIPLATGAALSAKVRKSDQVSLCFFGDGAVNQGTFHESLNMGSLWKLPVVYVCENNRYAITTSLAQSHAQTSIAKRAESYGMPGVTVDGQDVRVVYEAASTAVQRARRGEGPTLIEAQTYRFDEHNVGLLIPGKPYRAAEEVDQYQKNRDPIALFRQHLLGDRLSAAELTAIEQEVEAAVKEAILFGESSPMPDPADLYEHLYSPRVDVSGRVV